MNTLAVVVKKFSIAIDENIIKELDEEVKALNINNPGKPVTRNWLIGKLLKDHTEKNKTE